MEQMKELGVERIGVAPQGKESWKVSKCCEDRLSASGHRSGQPEEPSYVSIWANICEI